MRKHILILGFSLLLEATPSAKSATVSAEPFPATTTATYYYVNGTLTNAKGQLGTGPFGWGYYDKTFTIASTSSYSSDECCDENDEEGKEWLIPNSSIDLTISSVYQTVKVPEWIDRTTCTSADTEWARWATDVANHERRHDSDYKTYLANTSNYDGQVNDWEPITACSQIEETQAKSQLDQDLADSVEMLGQDINARLDQLANQFHAESGRPNAFPAIDLSQECP